MPQTTIVPSGSPVSSEALAVTLPTDVGRFHDFGHSRKVQARKFDKLFAPIHQGHVEKQSSLRFYIVGRRDSRRQIAHIVFYEKDVFCCGEDLGLVVFQPHHLRQRPSGRRHLICRLEDFFTEFFAQDGAFPDASLVGPHYCFADGRIVFVEKHGVVRRAIEGDYRNAFKVDVFRFQGEQRLSHRAVPVGRILFRPARFDVFGRVLDRRFADNTAVRRRYGRYFTAAGAEVYAEKYVFFGFHYLPTTHLWSGSSDEISPRLFFPHIVQR